MGYFVFLLFIAEKRNNKNHTVPKKISQRGGGRRSRCYISYPLEIDTKSLLKNWIEIFTTSLSLFYAAKYTKVFKPCSINRTL